VFARRSREISALVESWKDSYAPLVGSLQRCSVVDIAADSASLVGHTKAYTQVLLPAPAPDGSGSVMGCVVEARIVAAGRWSVHGEVLRVLYRPPAGADAEAWEGGGTESGEVGGNAHAELGSTAAAGGSGESLPPHGGVAQSAHKGTAPAAQGAELSAASSDTAAPAVFREPADAGSPQQASTALPAASTAQPKSDAIDAATSSAAPGAGAATPARAANVPFGAASEAVAEALVWLAAILGLTAVLVSGLLKLLE
jgi:hypothetical protein